MYQFLNEDQQLMVQNAREFAEEEIRPRVRAIEETDEFPHDLIEKLRELGYLSMYLPEEYGGLGEKLVTHMAIVEEFARVNFMMGVVGNQSMISEMLVDVATEEQKAKFFPKYSEEGAFAGFAFTEPTAGSDSAGIKTTAVKDGDDWIINGQKTFISYIVACEAFLVSARTNETGNGGISTFFVEKNTPGVKVGSIFKKLGFRGSDTGELFFENVRVPAINMIGPENKGLSVVLGVLNTARMAIAACGVGIAQGAFEKAVEFVKQREQFGKPVCKNQGVQWYLAEMETKIEAARALVYSVAEQHDAGKSIISGAAQAKLFAAEMAQEVTKMAVQLCGGYGLVDDFDLERYYRDAMILSITEGTSEIMKIVISRDILK